jgi:hypothetical protein
MKQLRPLIITASLVVGLAVPAIASAHRPATHAERVAITRAEGQPKGIPSVCDYIDIATVVKGSQWAADQSNNQRAGRPPCQRSGQGITVLHKRNGRWHDVHTGPSVNLLPIPGVPSNIARDLLAGLKF